MTKFVELHLIQNFAPSCLNRDDTNTPKDCVFGGYRRARISRQCLKRSIRTSEAFVNTLNQEIGCRSKLLVDKLTEKLIANDRSEEISRQISSVVITKFMSALEKDGKKTKVLLYLGDDEIERMKDLILSRWDDLKQAASQSETTASEEDETKSKKKKKEKDTPLQQLCEELKKAYKSGTKAADIALFGRMMAEAPKFNIDAASQVAHAISTHKVAMEMDFYTAVDDLQTEEETGAGMMGFSGFNASCFYRYSLVDIQQLKANLQHDEELIKKTVEAFLKASIEALPSGKQNSSAAHSRPDTIFAVVRDSGAPLSLVNAFEKPVNVRQGKSLVEASTSALDSYWQKITGIYGQDGIITSPICSTCDSQLEHFGNHKVKSFSSLLDNVLNNITVA